MSRKNKKKKAMKRLLNDMAAIRGIERAEHFAAGGTLTQWRGAHKVHKSRTEKRRSRKGDRQKAIDDSKE